MFDRHPVNVKIDFVTFQTDFRIPNKYKVYQPSRKNFQVEVSLTSKKDDCFRHT